MSGCNQSSELTIIRLPQVLQQTGLSRSTIYSLMKAGQFPPSVPIGARAIGFVRSDIDSWVNGRIAMRRR